MALLEELNEINLVPPLRRKLASGELRVNLDGKIEQTFRFNVDPVWIHVRYSEDRECGMWHKIHFDLFQFVPSPCFDCWKVVAKPRNLKETMKILDLQKELDLPSKVGMEKREYSGDLGGWSAFWYAPLAGGLAGARELFKKVSEAVADNIDPDIRVYLKRACTEMEMGIGPSDKWVWNPNLALIEDLVNVSFVHPPKNLPTPKFLEVDVMTRWIYWAAIHGDETYLDYVERPFGLIAKAVEYQGSIHNEKDFPSCARKESLAWAGKRKEEEKCLIAKV